MKRKNRSKGKRSQRGIYILPNLFTSANLFCGFYAMIAAIQGFFVRAAVAIMIAAVFDGLDGRIARVTRSVSKFGLEYDSLCDAISFGVAPGLLAYLWALEPFGRLGWLAALLFVACGTLRLARFNTQTNYVGSTYFNGLPIPAAAFMIAATVLFLHHLGGTGTTKHVTIVIMIYVLSFLMVSTVKYYSFKHVEVSGKMKFNVLVMVILFSILTLVEPIVILFFLILGYVVSGPFTSLWLHRRKQHAKAVVTDEADATPQESR